MTQHYAPKGVMDKSYAKARQENLALSFRLKVRARIVANAVKRYMGTSTSLRILDFGSAEGLTLLELNSLLPSAMFFGIEYSDELIRCVPELPPNIQIRKGNVMDLPDDILDESFDIVSALAVLEHLSCPYEAIHKAAKILRPGGIFVATCPNPSWDLIAGLLGMVGKEHHEAKLYKESIIFLVKKTGMELLSYERFMWAPITFLTYLKVPVSPSLSLEWDRGIGRIKILDWLFVNQCIIARKLP